MILVNIDLKLITHKSYLLLTKEKGIVGNTSLPVTI